jgi:hypothetical protein
MPQVTAIKVRPKRWQENKFGISALPQQEITQALFPT